MKFRFSFIIVSFLITLSGCSFGHKGSNLDELRTEVAALQNNPKVLLYAPAEMKQAEDALILAVKSWNSGQRSKADEYAEIAEDKIAITKEVTKREAALGLSDEAWEQRRWLREVRNKRLHDHTTNN